MRDILMLAEVLLLISACVTLPPTVWLLVWRRRKGGARSLPNESNAERRIGRIESELETLAADVARLNEAQQFLTNLLAEKSHEPRPLHGSSPPAS